MKKENGQSSAVIDKNETAPIYMLNIEKESLNLLDVAQKTNEEIKEYYPKMLEEDYSETEADEKLESLKRANTNITKVLVHTASMRDELSARQNDIKKQKKKRKFISTAPSNASIDLSENKGEHFAKGMNIYKILLICFMGSFAGVVVELLWCLLVNGYIESRSGLVYGPFNLLYGVGAVALSLCLYKFRNRGRWISFVGGMAIGSIVEYVCSWGQELLFGSRSWDYSHMPFNINGRICLIYSVFWGLLGVLWIKNIYPRMAKAILKIPNRVGKTITILLLVFFIFNGFVSSVSMFRWSQRDKGIQASNSFWELIDKRFPDERMERIYANMKFSQIK